MTPNAKRYRARRIREAAEGFDDHLSQTLIQLAEGLEMEAAQEDAQQRIIAQQREQSDDYT